MAQIFSTQLSSINKRTIFTIIGALLLALFSASLGAFVAGNIAKNNAENSADKVLANTTRAHKAQVDKLATENSSLEETIDNLKNEITLLEKTLADEKKRAQTELANEKKRAQNELASTIALFDPKFDDARANQLVDQLAKEVRHDFLPQLRGIALKKRTDLSDAQKALVEQIQHYIDSFDYLSVFILNMPQKNSLIPYLSAMTSILYQVDGVAERAIDSVAKTGASALEKEKSTLQTRTAELETLQKEHTALVAKQKETATALDALERTHANTQNLLTSAQARASNAETRLSQAERNLATANKNLATANKNLTSANERATNAQKNADNTKKQLATETARANKLANELATKERNIATLNKTNKDLETKLANANKALTDATNSAKQNADELLQAEQKLRTTQAELAKANALLAGTSSGTDANADKKSSTQANDDAQ